MQSRSLLNIDNLAPLAAASQCFVLTERLFSKGFKKICANLRSEKVKILVDQNVSFMYSAILLGTVFSLLVIFDFLVRFVDRGFAPGQLMISTLLVAVLPYCAYIRDNLYKKATTIAKEIKNVQEFLLKRFEQEIPAKEFFSAVINAAIWAFKMSVAVVKIRLNFSSIRQKRTDLKITKNCIVPNAPSL